MWELSQWEPAGFTFFFGGRVRRWSERSDRQMTSGWCSNTLQHTAMPKGSLYLVDLLLAEAVNFSSSYPWHNLSGKSPKKPERFKFRLCWKEQTLVMHSVISYNDRPITARYLSWILADMEQSRSRRLKFHQQPPMFLQESPRGYQRKWG